MATYKGKLLLLRGLPGAGKSTLAQILAQPATPVFSVDDYFTDVVTGAYLFRYEDNHLAYKSCEQKTEAAIIRQEPLVIVHNTFVYDWELAPYLALAARHQYQLFVVTVEHYHENGNVHAVSQEQIEKMAEKYAVKLY